MAITNSSRYNHHYRDLDLINEEKKMTELTMWVVYDNPTDHPGKIVARRWVMVDNKMIATEDIVLTLDLGKLREQFEKYGLTKLDRHPGDDPKIKEVWL